MFSRFLSVRMKVATALVAVAILAVVFAYSFPATHAAAQQPPPAGGPPGAAPAGRGGGGSPFTHAAPVDYNDHTGFVSLFDGSTLNGWTSDGTHWSVNDGAIYAVSTCENPTGTIYIYSNIGQVSDFELRVRMKGTGNVNSGVQYRSWLTSDINAPQFPRMGRGPGGPGGAAGAAAPGGGGSGAGGTAAGARGGAGGGRGPTGPCPSGQPRGTPLSRDLEAKYDMGGPQYDFDNNDQYPGQFYEQLGRGIIAWPGDVVETDPGKPKVLLSTLADAATLKTWFHKDDWNEETIIARGHTYTHILNGHVTSILIDNDPLYFQSTGHIGFEIESTGEVFIKDIWLKRY
jgi:Domain of Unknown Function (DUF1080)